MVKKILWTKSGCVRCDDFKNAGLYDKIEGLQELSLEETDGLALSCFYEMWLKGDSIETPCLYVGKDKFGDKNAIRIAGDEIKVWIEKVSNLTLMPGEVK